MYTSLLLFIFVSIIFSFLCSLWEAVLLSISPSYMQIKQNEGSKVGSILKDFKENIDKPLAGILTLNTIAHTVGAIGVGQEATKIWTGSHPLILSVLVPVAMTAAILIISEIIPKTIGATHWRALAPFTVKSLNILLIVLMPIIWLCQLITKAFNAKTGESIFTRNDFIAMAQIGSNEGHLDKMETDFILNLLHFKNFKVKDIMTPRTVLTSASQHLTFKEFYDMQDELVFSRIPLLESELSDVIIGYVLKDEVLEEIVDGNPDKKLSEIKREIPIITEDYNIVLLFKDFIEKREHLALVIDEYGSTLGLVTMEDVVETLLGAEIVDETDKIVDLQDHAKQTWRNRYKTKKVYKNPANS
jgi:CBS domain containing-hemolysin-like protein